MARWQLSPQERQNLRMLLGRLLVGPDFNSEKPLIDQILEKLGGSTEQKTEEFYPMPSDYAGGIEEWSKLSLEQKKAVHENLRRGRKIYIVQYSEPSRRGTLDSITLEKQHLQKIMETQW